MYHICHSNPSTSVFALCDGSNLQILLGGGLCFAVTIANVIVSPYCNPPYLAPSDGSGICILRDFSAVTAGASGLMLGCTLLVRIASCANHYLVRNEEQEPLNTV